MSLLEVEYSKLSSDIDQKAYSMGMHKVAQVENVQLPRDIVALDSNGRLSLSGSIARLTQERSGVAHAQQSDNSYTAASTSVSNRSVARS